VEVKDVDYGEARCVVEKQTAKKHARKMKKIAEAAPGEKDAIRALPSIATLQTLQTPESAAVE